MHRIAMVAALLGTMISSLFAQHVQPTTRQQSQAAKWLSFYAKLMPTKPQLNRDWWVTPEGWLVLRLNAERVELQDGGHEMMRSYMFEPLTPQAPFDGAWGIYRSNGSLSEGWMFDTLYHSWRTLFFKGSYSWEEVRTEKTPSKKGLPPVEKIINEGGDLGWWLFGTTEPHP